MTYDALITISEVKKFKLIYRIWRFLALFAETYPTGSSPKSDETILVFPNLIWPQKTFALKDFYATLNKFLTYEVGHK
jgi:hypothetical protein